MGIGALVLCLSAALLIQALSHQRSDGAASKAAEPQSKEHVGNTNGLASTGVAPAASHEPLRVLFVGSTWTAANDLPKMIARLAKAAGEERPFAPKATTFDGFTLSDHLAANNLPSLLSSTSWDAVVLQEQTDRAGPSAAEQEKLFFAPLRVLDAMIRKAGAKTVLYIPYLDPRAHDLVQERVIAGQIAAVRDAEVVRVGAVWARARREHVNMALWSTIGIRPSETGTYLAACAFYAHFYRRSPEGNSYRVANLTAGEALALQQSVAAEILNSSPPPGDSHHAPSSETPPATAPVAVASDAVAPAAPTAPDIDEDRIRHERIVAEAQDRALRVARRRVSIVVYTRENCDDCESAIAYLRSVPLEFQLRDMDQDPQALAAARRLTPRTTAPLVDIDGRTVIGWNEQRFERAFDLAIRERAGDDAPPASNTLLFEGESFLPPEDSAAPVHAQSDCCGVSWSGGAQLFMQATKAGDDIWLNLEVPETGSYDLSAVMTQASDYGIVEFRLDGSAIGTFDGYAANTVRSTPIGFGIKRLTSGHHPLILVVTGKNAKSKNYLIGLDVLRLRRVTP